MPSINEKLGYDADEKVVIMHIDDMGFSHAGNVGPFECLDFGVASCGSVIVPSPWFLETASICRKNPKYDVGVHLTLTCEYDLYRWRALSTVDPSSGLLDSEGCLWRTTAEAVENVTVAAAELEMRAQIQKAFDNGIDVTHIDTHMGTVVDPKFIPIYIKMAKEFDVPLFLPRVTKPMLLHLGFGEMADTMLKMFEGLEETGVPMLDHIIIDTLSDSEDKIEYYCKRFEEIQPGLTHLLFHAAKNSPELRAITPRDNKWRDLDYKAFTDPRLKEYVEESDLKIIGYRYIRDTLRGSK